MDNRNPCAMRKAWRLPPSALPKIQYQFPSEIEVKAQISASHTAHPVGVGFDKGVKNLCYVLIFSNCPYVSITSGAKSIRRDGSNPLALHSRSLLIIAGPAPAPVRAVLCT